MTQSGSSFNYETSSPFDSPNEVKPDPDALVAGAAILSAAVLGKSCAAPSANATITTTTTTDEEGTRNSSAPHPCKKMYHCECCDAYFSTGFNLRRHIRRKHNDAVEGDTSQSDAPVVKCVRPIGRVLFLADDQTNLYMQFQQLDRNT